MHHVSSRNIETDRALREIILAIIETNFSEMKTFVSHKQIMGEVFSSLGKSNNYSKGIYVDIKENQIDIQLSVNIYTYKDLIGKLIELQRRIYEDVLQITGLKVASIDLKLIKILTEEK